jgi:hypothetical protein
MTLAAILALFLLSLSPASASYQAQASAPSQAPTAQTSSAPAQASSGQASSGQASPNQASPDQASADKPRPTPKPHHRQKTNTANCPTATPAPNSAENPAPSNPCPPPKKVVPHGGLNDPAVHVTGGTTAEQASHQRSTEQLKLATEENLKKIEGRQLSPAQQEMKNQIKQFMEQSKAAADAGDLDRAHNLALKAHLLSEELVKP